MSSNSCRHRHQHNHPRLLMVTLVVSTAIILGSCGTDGFSPTALTVLPQHLLSNANNERMRRNAALTKLLSDSGIDPDRKIDMGKASVDDGKSDESFQEGSEMHKDATTVSAFWSALTGGGPPLDIDDTDLLIYDVFLLVNLSFSISFLVIHRMDYLYIPSSLNEGALLSICWILAGLANGTFLYSAVDGHYDPQGKDYAEKGGPKGAGLLALSTFITTSSLRIMMALGVAMMQHRPVGQGGEELIPLEILFGFVLMSAWRCLHSANTPRI